MKIKIKRKYSRDDWKEILRKVQELVKPKALNVSDDYLEFEFREEPSKEVIKLVKSFEDSWIKRLFS